MKIITHQSSVPTADYFLQPYAIIFAERTMAEVELKVDEAEENEFVQKERPYWPFIPSPCTVPVCQGFGKFSSYRDFREHWTRKHTKELSHYICQECGKKFANNKHAKAHTKSRIHKGKTITIKYVQEPNTEFINPWDTLPYQLGDKEDRANMITIQRHRLAEERREMNKRKIDVSKIPYVGDSVCRDERVVEREGRLYKDTGLWGPPEKRKRIPLMDKKADQQ